MEILDSLNPQQREAVQTTEGALLILAGAGSGKTRVITVRIAYLISEKQVAPYNILAVTFTNKAAGEMRERVNELLKGQKLNSAPLVTTFHSLCVRILRQDIENLAEGFTKSFTIYDTDDSIKVIKACVKDIGLDEKEILMIDFVESIKISLGNSHSNIGIAYRSAHSGSKIYRHKFFVWRNKLNCIKSV